MGRYFTKYFRYLIVIFRFGAIFDKLPLINVLLLTLILGMGFLQGDHNTYQRGLHPMIVTILFPYFGSNCGVFFCRNV